MHHQLAGQPASVLGIVAPRASLPSGSSVVTVAERADLRPDAECHVTGVGSAVPGAVLLRAGVPFEVHGDTVEIHAPDPDAPDVLVIDPGAVAVAAPTSDLAPADPAGRPPFRWRPVVLFLAGDADEPTARAAAHTADALILHDVEARLAVHGPAPALRLTQACLAIEASVVALRPDVIVALDHRALEHAERWSPTRSTVTVAWDPDLGASSELVSWTIGSARGRLRARIGPDVEVGQLAALLNRLCSGPHPAPPVDMPVDVPADVAVQLEPRTDAHGSEPTSTVHVLGDGAGSTPVARALIDHFRAAGHEVVQGRARKDSTSDGRELSITDLTSARRTGTGDPDSTIIVVEPDDASAIRAGDIDRSWWRGRLVVVTERRTAHALRVLGAHPIVVPILLPPDEVASLTDAARHRIRPPVPTIGWIADADIGSSMAERARRSTALVELLVEHAPDASIEIVGLAPAEVAALSLPEQVTGRSIPPDPTGLASWTAQVWLPAERSLTDTGDLRTLARAVLAGVPTAVVLTDHELDGRAVGGLVDPQLVLSGSTDPGSWCATVARLVTDDAWRGARSVECRRRAQALFASDSARHTVDRVIGWYDARRPA